MPAKFDREEVTLAPLQAESEAKEMLESAAQGPSLMPSSPGWSVYLLPPRDDIADIPGEVKDLKSLFDTRSKGKPAVIKDPSENITVMLKNLAENELIVIHDATGRLSAQNLRGVVEINVDDALKALAITKATEEPEQSSEVPADESPDGDSEK